MEISLARRMASIPHVIHTYFIWLVLLSRRFRADRRGAASLMFGLGMNNNGAGLVLASLALSDHPAVMIPVIVYNLVQHLFASLVDKILTRKFD
jgi:bile acid:Na+ symporter, BASS family